MNCEACNLKELVNNLLSFLDQFIVLFVFLLYMCLILTIFSSAGSGILRDTRGSTL